VKRQTVPDASSSGRKRPITDSGQPISADVDDDLSLCLGLMSAHRDISAPGYADSGRRGPTVCTRHAVVLATSAGGEEVCGVSRCDIN